MVYYFDYSYYVRLLGIFYWVPTNPALCSDLICGSMYLFICLSKYVSTYLFIFQSSYLSIDQRIYLSIYINLSRNTCLCFFLCSRTDTFFFLLRAGMAWLVAATVLAAVVSVARADAGHFFAETPKHLPRIGRRGDLPPLVSQSALLCD